MLLVLIFHIKCLHNLSTYCSVSLHEDVCVCVCASENFCFVSVWPLEHTFVNMLMRPFLPLFILAHARFFNLWVKEGIIRFIFSFALQNSLHLPRKACPVFFLFFFNFKADTIFHSSVCLSRFFRLPACLCVRQSLCLLNLSTFLAQPSFRSTVIFRGFVTFLL